MRLIDSTGGMMAFTEQERALEQVQAKYGKTGFAFEHLNYRMVGFKRGDKTISATGATWDEAIAELGKKEK